MKKIGMVSLENLTIPARFILPITMTLFFWVYNKDKKTETMQRTELTTDIALKFADIKSSLKTNSDEQRELMQDYRTWRDRTNDRLTTVEVGCCGRMNKAKGGG